MAKGSSFEREVCVKFSLWWSEGQEDDIFWRSQTSGARATSRAKRGKQTRGHCGDMSATDGRGIAFTALVTPEIKRGYNKVTVGDILDRGGHMAQQKIEEFFEQAIEAAERAGTPYWMIIHKRDQRQPIVYLPYELYTELGPFSLPTLEFTARVNLLDGTRLRSKIAAITLEVFLQEVSPKTVRKLVDSYAI